MVGTGPLEAHSGHSKEHSNLEGETMGDPKMGPLTPPPHPHKMYQGGNKAHKAENES